MLVEQLCVHRAANYHLLPAPSNGVNGVVEIVTPHHRYFVYHSAMLLTAFENHGSVT